MSLSDFNSCIVAYGNVFTICYRDKKLLPYGYMTNGKLVLNNRFYEFFNKEERAGLMKVLDSFWFE